MQINNIWRGDAGLAVTYWGYGMLGGALLSIPLAFVTPGSISALIAVLSFVLYCVLVYVGIWRAAAKYQGPKIWAFLPRAAIVLTLASVVIGIGAAIVIPSASNGDYAQNGRLKAPATAQVAGECKRSMDTIKEIRAKRPEWSNLSDDSVVNVVRELYYPELTTEQMAWEMCVELTPPKPKTKLGPIDVWYYESCRKEAAHAPTSQGVNIGMQLCRDKFSQ